jgi:SHS2 domain-containing protein
MKKFEILEHKADLKIRAFGKTKEELFLNMLSGMSENMKPELQKPGEKTKRKIKLSSFGFQALLVDFLSEVLYLSQVNKEVYNKVEFREFSETEGKEDKSSSSPFTAAWEIDGEIFGQKVERFSEDIKAVTHHDLNIQQNPEGIWEATVIFDI